MYNQDQVLRMSEICSGKQPYSTQENFSRGHIQEYQVTL